jgi:hypothetical protein
MNTFYCLRFETPPTWWARSPYLYPPETGWPGYTQRHWVPFSSTPTTRRATVEVFEPTSTRAVTTLSYPLYRFGTDRIQNNVFDSSSIVAWVSVVAIIAYAQCTHVFISDSAKNLIYFVVVQTAPVPPTTNSHKTT